VHLLLATRQLVGPGGAETYLVTLAEGLRRLGHHVTLTASTIGEGAGGGRDAGFAVVAADAELDPPPDAIVVQDRVLSLRLAHRYSDAPQVFVVHGVDHDYELPQPGAGVVAACVVLNGRHERRARALEGGPPVVRLRQPIDMRRFKPYGQPRERPERALVLSNNFPPERLATLLRAWGPAGVDVTTLGRNDALGLGGAVADDPRAAISAADVVVGYGRAMLEAMACRRAAFVFAGPGGDGWVTGERYPAMEADGFAGGAFSEVYDEQRLLDALDDYDPELGQIGRDLVRFPHDAADHAAAIVGLLDEAVAPGRATSDGLPHLARMVDVLWQSEGRAATLRVEIGRLYEELGRREEWLVERDEAIAALESELGRYKAMVGSRRYKLGTLLAQPLDRLRRRG
jgi:hypothetical protein